MAVDVLKAEEITFTLATSKKHKGRSKVSFLSFMSFSNSKSKISWAPPLSKAVTTCIVMTILKTIWHLLLCPWSPNLSLKSNYLLKLQKPILLSKLQSLLLPYLMRTFCAYYSLRRYFLIFLKLQSFLCTKLI